MATETETTENTPSEIVKARIEGLDTSIAKRLGQIKKTIKRASNDEKAIIAKDLETVDTWVRALIDLCFAVPDEEDFSLSNGDGNGDEDDDSQLEPEE